MTPYMDHVLLSLDGMVPSDRRRLSMQWNADLADAWGAQLRAVATEGERLLRKRMRTSRRQPPAGETRRNASRQKEKPMAAPVDSDHPYGVEKPLVPAWRKKEMVCLLDLSTSMSWPAAEGAAVSRQDIVAEAFPLLVKALEDQDSAAAGEQAGGSDELGGVLVHGFSDQHRELGDFNTSNFTRRWSAIPWGGGTTIMPAWKAALEDFLKEFGDEDEPPALLTLVITDGEATDAAEFARVLEKEDPSRYFAVAILGHGRGHDATLRSYQQVAQRNPKHVAVIPFESVTDPQAVADALILMAGAA